MAAASASNALENQAQNAARAAAAASFAFRLTVVPFMIAKSMWWLPTAVVWYFGARSIVAVNPNGHRILMARLQHLPMKFWTKPVQFRRSRKGRDANV